MLQKIGFEKSGTIYPTEQRCLFFELATFQQYFTAKFEQLTFDFVF
jgi:hypothetical protein